MTISLSAKAITIFDRRVQNLPGWMCTFRNRVNTLQVWKILSCGMLFKKRCEVPIGSVIMLIIYEILWFRAQQLVSFQVVNTHFLSKHIKWIRLQFIWGRVVTNFNIGNLGNSLVAFNSLGFSLHFLPPNHRVISNGPSPEIILTLSVCSIPPSNSKSVV